MLGTFSAADASILTGGIAGAVAIALGVMSRQEKRAEARRARSDAHRADLAAKVEDLARRVGPINGQGPVAHMLETLLVRQGEIQAELRAQRSELDVGLQRQSIEHAQTAAKVDEVAARLAIHLHDHQATLGDGR